MAFLDNRYLITNATGLELFAAIRKLPVIDPHNHADMREIARNECYRDAWQLFAATDHYVWEMLRKCGVPEELITGSASPRDKFLALGQVFPLIAGNPVYEWIHLDLKRYFGIEELLSESTAERIYDAVNAKLATDAYRPQALLTGVLNVESMSSTDDLIDTLEFHEQANAAIGRQMIRPTWRPDKAMKIFAPTWREYIAKVGERFGMKIRRYSDLIEAMRRSHDYFAERGCRASDHGVDAMPVVDCEDAAHIFHKAINGKAPNEAEAMGFMGAFLGEAAKLDAEKGWVMQLHMGAVRDVRTTLFEALGPDVGGDVCNVHRDFLPGMVSLLNRFDNKLKAVFYCLDPNAQATLASITRAFGDRAALGSAWWLNDTPIGMKRQLELIGSIDLFSNFAGMVSDSRKLLSYGSRFEMFRRVLADVLGAMVERGQMPLPVAEMLAERMAYSGPKAFWNL
ncbi:MAG: glucuronate isomerase [Lentisphaeria bacterium]|nr:glucuronate isomerase [Lentisphaeria bacterium]